jgi:hypothetical protein
MRPASRRARAILGIVSASMFVGVVTGPVAAAAPQQVAIVSHVTFNPDGPNFGDFTATGQAVDGHRLCGSGTFVDTGIRFAGFQSDRAGRTIVQLQVDKRFTCGDDSGSFFVRMQIRADFDTGFETFTWVVLGGTGDYDHLSGRGSGSTVRDGDGNGNTNTYVGFLPG